MLSSCLIRSDFQTTSSSLRAAFVLPDTLPNFTVTLDFSGLVLEWRQTVGGAMKQEAMQSDMPVRSVTIWPTAFAEGVMRTLVLLYEKGLIKL